ncbi:hypothetical protein DV515_00003493, partial [Chloebia gouldiae]
FRCQKTLLKFFGSEMKLQGHIITGDLRVRKEQWPLQRPKSDSPEQRDPHCSWHGAHQSEGADHQPKGEQQQAQDLNPLGWESCLLPAKSKERGIQLGDDARWERFYGNLLLQGGALAFTQLLLCPSISSSLSEEEIQSSTLKFAL